ncbi:hypothetical protein [Ensifer sp. MJa1]|uniref:hypothetical protein n=1 Tax=Ensifer sp. MJa1 TaxID=2919888 RepID=UPI003008B5AF
MLGLNKADARRSRSASMSGPMDERQALAAIILWNSGHFDTQDIADVLGGVGEDAVCRTLHAARLVQNGGV